MPPWIHFSALLSSESTNFNYTTKYFIDKVTNSRRQTRDMHAWFLTLTKYSTILIHLFTHSIVFPDKQSMKQYFQWFARSRFINDYNYNQSQKSLYKENSFNFNKKKKNAKIFIFLTFPSFFHSSNTISLFFEILMTRNEYFIYLILFSFFL